MYNEFDLKIKYKSILCDLFWTTFERKNSQKETKFHAYSFAYFNFNSGKALVGCENVIQRKILILRERGYIE